MSYSYTYIAHKGALWRYTGTQLEALVQDIRDRKEIALDNYGGRLITGRLIALDRLIFEVTSESDEGA